MPYNFLKIQSLFSVYHIKKHITYHWNKIQQLEVMMVEKRGISVIVVTQASICHWLEGPNRKGSYPFTNLINLISLIFH